MMGSVKGTALGQRRERLVKISRFGAELVRQLQGAGRLAGSRGEILKILPREVVKDGSPGDYQDRVVLLEEENETSQVAARSKVAEVRDEIPPSGRTWWARVWWNKRLTCERGLTSSKLKNLGRHGRAQQKEPWTEGHPKWSGTQGA